jgi:hypothetical protein
MNLEPKSRLSMLCAPPPPPHHHEDDDGNNSFHYSDKIPQRKRIIDGHERIIRLPAPESCCGSKTTMTTDKALSPSIPIIHPREGRADGGWKRASSELRLQEEEEIASFRDYVFFTRLVEGIASRRTATRTAPQQQQLDHSSEWLKRQNDLCLAHIIGTRNGGSLGHGNNRSHLKNTTTSLWTPEQQQGHYDYSEQKQQLPVPQHYYHSQQHDDSIFVLDF